MKPDRCLVRVYVGARARALHWSGVPSVLQGRGLFPGNWVVQKPGRSSQQRGGNTRPVTLLVISRDKAEERWDELCVRLREWERDSITVSMMRPYRFSSRTTSPKCPLSIYAGRSRSWQYLACVRPILLFPYGLLQEASMLSVVQLLSVPLVALSEETCEQ